MSPTSNNIKVLISAFYTAVIIISVLAFFFLLQINDAQEKYVSQLFKSSANEISQSIAYDLKFNDLVSVRASIKNSYLNQRSEFLFLHIDSSQTDLEFLGLSQPLLNKKCPFEYEEVKIFYLNEELGNLKYCYDKNKYTHTHILKIFFAFILFSILATTLLLFVWFKKQAQYKDEFIAALSSLSISELSLNSHAPIKIKDEYLNSIFLKFKIIVDELINKRLALAELDLQKALYEQAKQVAHDIRSPLAALNMMLNLTTQLPEDKRLIIRSAVTRIKEIANGLLNLNKKPSETINHSGRCENLKKIHLYSLITEVLTEKSFQYRFQNQIKINFLNPMNSTNIFVEVDPHDFKRVISNILNNSIEAISAYGAIDISVSKIDSSIEITISDNGTGISPEKINSVMQKGISFNKINGSGLGLYHAKKMIESWNGQVHLESVENVGTIVKIILPQIKSPEWYLTSLSISKISTIIIVDDDPTIHLLWNKILENWAKINNNVILNFENLPHAKLLIAQNKLFLDKTLFLIDYEFIDFDESGFNFIINNKIQEYSILVTNHHENEHVISNCVKNNIKILPKILIPHTPIHS